MDKYAEHFWNGCAAGELRYQRCNSCAAAQMHARAFCLRCGGADVQWQAAKGTGTVYACTTVQRAPSDEFRTLVPYDILLVDLDEGCRMMAHGVPGLAIGERVRFCVFEHGGLHLPRFEKAG